MIEVYLLRAALYAVTAIVFFAGVVTLGVLVYSLVEVRRKA